MTEGFLGVSPGPRGEGGGVFADPNGGYPRRDHINVTSADIDLAVDAGAVDETPEDPTDDRYGTNKVLLWSQHAYILVDESYGLLTRLRDLGLVLIGVDMVSARG